MAPSFAPVDRLQDASGSTEDLCAGTHCCVSITRFQRGLKRKPLALIKKLRKAKREAASGEKPEPVRTHLRNMIIVPEMIGSVIGVYNGKTFNQVGVAMQWPPGLSNGILQAVWSLLQALF